MAKDANRFYVDVCLEIYVPDQGCGEKAVKNENLDAEWLLMRFVIKYQKQSIRILNFLKDLIR